VVLGDNQGPNWIAEYFVEVTAFGKIRLIYWIVRRFWEWVQGILQQYSSNVSHYLWNVWLISPHTKKQMNNKAIILNDETITDNPEGVYSKRTFFIQGIESDKKDCYFRW
jgi:hypothetical protein